MYSAFGVEHGEIEKRMPKMPSTGSLKPLKSTANAFSSGAAGVKQGAAKATGMQGGAYRAGAGLRRNAKPIGIAAGAGAGGAGAYSMGQSSGRKKQY